MNRPGHDALQRLRLAIYEVSEAMDTDADERMILHRADQWAADRMVAADKTDRHIKTES